MLSHRTQVALRQAARFSEGAGAAVPALARLGQMNPPRTYRTAKHQSRLGSSRARMVYN